MTAVQYQPAEAGAALAFTNATIGYDGHPALHHVSATFAPGTLTAVVGPNGAGKSTLLAALKAQLRGQAYYWPTQDRLAFAFNSGQTFAPRTHGEASEDADAIHAQEEAEQRRGYSSGERQLQVLREIVARTANPVYLLDEWDANLDAGNRAAAVALVDALARRARVIEISHRDKN